MLKKCSFFFALLGVISCNDRLTYSEYKTLENGQWNKDEIIEFTFSDVDTTALHNMFIQVRNDNNFPYSNLFLIAELNFPSGEKVKDTLEYQMALANGKWLGKGYGSLLENKLWYKENIVFPSSGVYTIAISHAMRKNGEVQGIVDLDGIIDVGFQIEKSDQ